jgi:exodeoxyribonuclease-3
MKLVSWNVNGLRAVHRKGDWDNFLKLAPNVFCLQETKARTEQLPAEVRSPEGYFSYFSSPVVKKGYSGVATYSKKEPLDVKYGLGEKKFDEEGRFLETHFENFVLINETRQTRDFCRRSVHGLMRF